MAREFLGRRKIEIVQLVEARQLVITEPEAWGMLKAASRILVGRGAKMEVFIPSAGDRQEIMDKVMGRSGSLRAPTLRSGSEFLVGYNEQMYRGFFPEERGSTSNR